MLHWKLNFICFKFYLFCTLYLNFRDKDRDKVDREPPTDGDCVPSGDDRSPTDEDPAPNGKDENEEDQEEPGDEDNDEEDCIDIR